MLSDPIFYLFAVPAVMMQGLAKGGFSGMGALSLPLMLFAIDPVRAAAILLPILIVQDVVSVWAFRRSIDWGVIRAMLPGACFGILLGYLYAASVSPAAIMTAVGVIALLFGLQRLWVERGGPVAPRHLPWWSAPIFGTVSGVTSQIAHAGAPPFQLWVVPRRLPREVLAGTSAFYFFAVNWIKVPAYAALGQFTAANMLTAAALMPIAVASTFAGVWLVRRVSTTHFYTIIYVLMVLVGIKLIWDGVS